MAERRMHHSEKKLPVRASGKARRKELKDARERKAAAREAKQRVRSAEAACARAVLEGVHVPFRVQGVLAGTGKDVSKLTGVSVA